jgi:SAM-dependent methyltransferase
MLHMLSSIQPNTYPLSNDSDNILKLVKEKLSTKHSDYLNYIDNDTISELNALCHPNILSYNIIRNDYIIKRFLSVLLYNFGYNNGRNFNDNLNHVDNLRLIEFVKDVFKVANITFVDESTKKIYLRTKFISRKFKPQIIDHKVRANFEFDILKKLRISDGDIKYMQNETCGDNLYEWLHNKNILDIGCGPGNILGELNINGVSSSEKLNGIDVSSYVHWTYADKLTLNCYEENFKFPFKIKFNFISFFMVLHHISLYKLHLIMLQLYEMLEDDGYIYVKEHLVECPEDVTFFKFMETYFYFIEEYLPNVPVEDNYYTKETLQKIFELYGFDIVTKFEINKNQPFKPFYYVFQKKSDYVQKNKDTESYNYLKMIELVNICAQMKIKNSFNNCNIYQERPLNDFSDVTYSNLFFGNMIDNEVEKTFMMIMAEMRKTVSEKEVMQYITKEEYDKLYTINKNQTMIIHCLIIFTMCGCGFCFFFMVVIKKIEY